MEENVCGPDFDDPEKFRDLPGYRGYKIGRDGSVWSFRNKKNPLLLKGYATEFGYHQVRLTSDIGIPRSFCLHAVMCRAFYGMPSPRQVCRHLDGNPRNNVLENLEYGTQKQNLEDCLRHGTIAHGEKCGLSKLSEQQVTEIRKLRFDKRISHAKIASMFGVCKKTISNICHGKTWARSSSSDFEPVVDQTKAVRELKERIIIEHASGLCNFAICKKLKTTYRTVEKAINSAKLERIHRE